MGLLTTSFATEGLYVLVGILLIWNIVLTWLVWKYSRTNKMLFGSETAKSLKEIVLEQMGKVGSLQVEVANVEQAVADVRRNSSHTIQKIGLVRFSPFEDTGSDQSFTLALLDDEQNGIVLSSLHGRDRTRIYVKLVKRGKSDEYALSEEEQSAIRQAVEQNS